MVRSFNKQKIQILWNKSPLTDRQEVRIIKPITYGLSLLLSLLLEIFVMKKKNNMLTVRCKSDCKNLGTYFSVTKRRVGYSYFLWKSEIWTGMCGVSVNTEILTVMSTIQSPLEHWLHWHRCHWPEKVPKCIPPGISVKVILICHFKCSDVKYETISDWDCFDKKLYSKHFLTTWYLHRATYFF